MAQFTRYEPHLLTCRSSQYTQARRRLHRRERRSLRAMLRSMDLRITLEQYEDIMS